MKKHRQYRANFFIVIVMLLYSCGGNQEEKQTTSPSGNTFLKEGPPAYDAKAIDPKAPVVAITLAAQGKSMADMTYDKTELKVAEGTTIQLTITNESTDSSMQHNFVLVHKGDEKFVADEGVKVGPTGNYVPLNELVMVSTPMLAPGAKITITFPAPPKGEYSYICTYPGHYTKMNGKLFVE